MTQKEKKVFKRLVLWRISGKAEGTKKVQNGQKQGFAYPEAES